MFTTILIIIGLILFEIVSSIDNAVINAEILKGLSKQSRRWFLTWGLLLAVFVVRGVLPFLIVWIASPALNIIEIVKLSFAEPDKAHHLIEAGAPLLLMGGGVFLFLLFLNWLFMEVKTVGLPHERFFEKQSMWFYAVSSIFLVTVLVFAEKYIHLSLAAAIGSTVYFIIHGVNQKAEEAEEQLLSNHSKSRTADRSKLMLLLLIDAVFSIDGVVGAFAFTTSVPLILIGNGIGALVVRQITISNIERIQRLTMLKNGAMYSIGILGIIMVLDSLTVHVPEWLAPISTVLIVGYFYYKSIKLNNNVNVT
jgi:uncharacterized protein